MRVRVLICVCVCVRACVCAYLRVACLSFLSTQASLIAEARAQDMRKKNLEGGDKDVLPNYQKDPKFNRASIFATPATIPDSSVSTGGSRSAIALNSKTSN